ncbi:MAG: FMN-binding glutamate synthase family protein, partial [Gammaproteobacteria bacterium]
MFLIESIGWIGITLIVVLAIIFYLDFSQSRHSVLRNFPVLGHLRYFLEKQGVYFRQYFFANDREELPFNRATRSWVYQAAKKEPGTIGFGSTNDLRQPGSYIFINSPYPSLGEAHCETCTTVIGAEADKPFISKNIVNISAMSYGALSKPAIQALSIGAGKANVWLNTGEGGLSPYHLEGECDLIFQIGTAKYGVRDEKGNLSDQKLKEVARHVRAFEIKLSQGAKPGKGGLLPGVKVTPAISRIRGIPIGKPSISPNRHLDIKTPDDLLDKIDHIRSLTGLPVGIKTVISSQVYIERLCEAIVRRGSHSAPDFITLDGGDGGTAAAPQALADHVGLPLSESLFILVDTL